MPLTATQQAVSGQLTAEQGPVTWTGPATRAGGGPRSGTAAARAPTRPPSPSARAGPSPAASCTPSRSPAAAAGSLSTGWPAPGSSPTARGRRPLAGSGEGDGPPRDRPWVNFTTAWDARHFAGGGATQARRVRVTFADGTTLADTVDNGVVLFWTSPGVTFPAHIEIHGAGEVLAAYDDFDYLASNLASQDVR